MRPTRPIVSFQLLPVIEFFFKTTSLTVYIRIPPCRTHKKRMYAAKYGVRTFLFFDVVWHDRVTLRRRLMLVKSRRYNNARWRGFDSCYVAAFHPFWQIYVHITTQWYDRFRAYTSSRRIKSTTITSSVIYQPL